MKENPFGITREEIMNLAAQKLVDQVCDDEPLVDFAHNEIRSKIKVLFDSKIQQRVDGFLQEEMSKILTSTIQPVDIWGDKAGSPTTIKEVLSERAKKFWEVRVDEQGRETSYGGVTRSERLLREITKEEFTKSIKDNASAIVVAFKAALEKDASEKIKEFINGLIRTK